MGVHLTAHLQQRGTGSREEAERASRTVEVSAATFDDGKRLVQEQLPDGWVVASWRVDRGVLVGRSMGMCWRERRMRDESRRWLSDRLDQRKPHSSSATCRRTIRPHLARAKAVTPIPSLDGWRSGESEQPRPGHEP